MKGKRQRGRKAAAAGLAVLLLFGLAGCGGPAQQDRIQFFALDTAITITVYGTAPEGTLAECEKLCRRYETLFSARQADSEIYRLNHREISQVSPETAELIQAGLDYSRLSGGAFDITVGAVSELWDFQSENPALPAAASVAQALNSVDWRGVHIQGTEVTFDSEETRLDLGAVAKGYIADRLGEFLQEQGVESAVIDLGGNILCIGQKPDGRPFSVGIQHPDGARGETASVVYAEDISVVTSGVYERSFEKDGVRYHHLLNPRTGYPYDNGLVSVTVMGSSSLQCDCLSTVCFSLGLEEGMKLIDETENVWAVFIDEDMTMHYSQGFQELLAEKE